MNARRISDKDLTAMTPVEAASYWLVRKDSQNMAAEDEREFEQWLAQSETHRRAYAQTDSMWKGFETSAEEGELRALRVAALAAGPAPKVWQRAVAIAAGVLITIGLGVLIGHRAIDNPATKTANTSAGLVQYVTAHNQRSTVTLPDGTLVSMNLDTAFSTDFSVAKRLIHLTRGQVFFEVAKDQRRPFIVAAADRQIRALGTKFDVRLDADRVEVVLLEGRVSVDRKSPALLDTLARHPAHVELEPGQRLVAAIGKQPAVTATNAAQVTSWREGWVVFEDETVEQAIAELNRYSERPIVTRDRGVRQMRLSGVFRIGQPDRFGAIIEELLPLAVEQGPHGETVLIPKQNGSTR